MTEAIKTAEKISALSKIAVQLAKEAVNTGTLLFKQFMILMKKKFCRKSRYLIEGLAYYIKTINYRLWACRGRAITQCNFKFSIKSVREFESLI